MERLMSPFTYSCLGALAATVALAASNLHAQDQPGEPRSLVPSAPSAEARALRSPVRLDNAARAGELLVPLNKSQVIEVDRPFAEVSIGNPEIADVVPLTRDSLYVFGKQFGTTSLTITDSNGGLIAVVDLVVSYDIEGLKGQMFQLLPGEAIEVRPASDGLVLSGRLSNAMRMQRALALAERYAPGKITNLMEVAGSQQVMLAVRFAEVSREVIKQLGANTDLLFQNGDVAISGSFGNGPLVDPTSFGATAFALTTGDVALNVVLDALEEKGVVKTLAEPNLISLSGDTASFLAGGEFPIPVGQDENEFGVDITIEFKPFGVSLSFTPTVIGEELINLELFTEVSDIDRDTSIQLSNLLIPGLTTRRARTTVELGNGQSFAIAGLLRDDFEDTVRKYPILGDVPVLGQLFRSNGYQLDQTELVVIVTPYLVQPASPTALITPADLFQAPTDAELFLQGKVEGERAGYDPANSADQLGRRSAAGIVGPHGYILR
jgi:pilus assembly protein CpaC